MRYLGGGIGHGTDPNLKDNDSREVETTDETGNNEPDDVDEDIEEDDEDDGEGQLSEDSGDSEGLSEEGADSNSNASVESGYLDIEDMGFSDF